MGIEGSIWASAPRITRSDPRPGDWRCDRCGFSNYRWRTSCLQCLPGSSGAVLKNSTLAAGRQPNEAGSGPYLLQPSDRRQAPFEQISSAGARNTSNASSPATSSRDEQGLISSIWAPRNAGGHGGIRIAGQVWTRRTALPQQTPNRSHAPPPERASELGLPYQVQHYILVMIERMLEESCYEFASRWVPELLHAKGWDCAEAVELATWKTFLPTALPHNAIRPLSNYTLEAALGDAVRIRNSAVHRHLCDTDEIWRMALQAQDLMSMFSDTTRQGKFHRLWAELKAWDVASTVDAQAARSTLEAALQEISERPVDDMDWTPNAMSLQEVTADEVAVQEHSGYMDAMDLD